VSVARLAHELARAVVDDVVAVVIDAVADLGCRRGHAIIAVVAVPARLDVRWRRRARRHRRVVVAEAVPVGVEVPRGRVGRVLVDLPVAVVVHEIARLVDGRRCHARETALDARVHARAAPPR
jgi:hypothetical protein